MAAVSNDRPIAFLGPEATLSPHQFRPVLANSPEMRDLTKIFTDILEPLYGPQNDALSKIAQGRDRQSFLLYNSNIPIGVIVFKTIPSNEFQKEGIVDSIEIKSLFVVNADQNSGRGLGSVLLNKCIEEVKRLLGKPFSLHVTVSESKPESLAFFRKKGFIPRFWWVNKYIKNVKEHVLFCPKEGEYSQHPQWIRSQEKKAVDRSGEALEEKAFEPKPGTPRILGYVQNAHWGDIHALKLLPDGTFISGSKDNSLHKWDREGKLVRIVYDVEPMGIDARDWITSVAVLNDEYWISGERNGKISLWSTGGNFVSALMPKLPRKDHVSHEFNMRRVNCLAASINKQKLSFFAGFPTLFDEYNVIERRTLSMTIAHENDWVYCIHPLQEDQILAVTAGNLDAWKKVDEVWSRSANLIKEPRPRSRNRQHISSLTCLDSSPDYFGMSLFEGYVKVINVSVGKISNIWREHTGNVWASENVTKDVFATSGQDGFVRFWDTRLKNCASSVKIDAGPVTALMRLNSNVLVAGTCPAEPMVKKEGASLVFYDIRK